ncbi:MAG TPA: AAA family ATPase [Vicinamibacterales bacterium]|nr:AAA family ATPase [Vicinamibacterales bacterium]
MYERFYNLRERPFSLSPDPDYLYPSRVHTEALNYLRYGIEGHAGFVVITGEIGSGKTTLLQTVLRNIDRRTSVARLVNTMLDARELIEAIMLDFGLLPQAGQSKPAMLRELARFLVEQRSAGRLTLLIVDEAQNLSPAALEEIRMLSNLETEKSKLIQIVLVGQPNLHDVLSDPDFEQLRQRVTVRYHLRALDPGETAAYINHRLKKAAIGAPMELSTPVTDLIGRASRGLPRRINIIADAVLLFGYGEDKAVIDVPLVEEVLAELRDTGVLPRTEAAPLAEPALAMAAPRREAGTAVRPAVAADAAAAAAALVAIKNTERELAERESRLATRERELSEQQRILTEQLRLMKMREAQTVAAGTTASWPPSAPAQAPIAPQGAVATTAAVASQGAVGSQGIVARPGSPVAASMPPAAPRPAANAVSPQFLIERRTATPTVWARMWRGLFGLDKPLLED